MVTERLLGQTALLTKAIGKKASTTVMGSLSIPTKADSKGNLKSQYEKAKVSTTGSMAPDTKVNTSKENNMDRVGSSDLTESSWVDSSRRIGGKESAITWSRRLTKVCMASSHKMTSMAWPFHLHIAINKLSTPITDSSRVVDLMALEFSNSKMAQSTRAHLKTVRKMELDFPERH